MKKMLQNQHKDARQHIRTALWRQLDHSGTEYASLWSLPSGWELCGTVVLAEKDDPMLVEYVVTCNAAWETKEVLVRVAKGGEYRELRLQVDEEQRWWDGEREVIAARGCLDVDLGVTPITNTLPIRRLALAPGEAALCDAAWIRFPDLAIELLPQRYIHIEPRRYRYESDNGAFSTDIVVDDLGLVTMYAKGWERVVTANSRLTG